MLLSLQPRGEASRAMLWFSPLLAALLTLLSGALLFALLGHPPLETLKVLLVDPLGDLYGVSELLVKALPILLCALGLAVVYNARIWNIGAEGQLLIGALAGSRDPLQPLAGLRGTAIAAEAKHLPFERVTSVADLEAKIAAAGKPVMLDFYADWCVSCKEMEKFTFADATVQARLAGYTLLQADVTANSADDKALLARFKLFGPPGIIFFDARGTENTAVRVVGFQNAEQFVKTLQKTGAAG